MSIAITGATGQLGRLILKELVHSQPAEGIIACVRDLEQASVFEEQGIQVRFCDYDQPESLGRAFAGVSKLLLISSSNSDDAVRLRQHKQVIDAANKASVAQLLYTSFAFIRDNADIPSNVHAATEHAIQATGIPYTFLRNALYTDFVGVLGLNEAVAAGELRYLPGDWTFNSVTRQDLAGAAAKVLIRQGDEHVNNIYELAAPQGWTFPDLAAALQTLTGKLISLRPDPQIQNWIYGFLRKIDTASTSNDLIKLTGRPIIPLAEAIKPFITLK
ncbi:NAD(P)H-binding protein [Paenibacillus luteus]|uniref:NAD(P)H-binding protein n=1 Tax=Paenibacillus luteus TaxID=2545753 RepID=UPI0011435D29|nr:NAD(P)H-binding protein [Paenibacillus luteus]